MKQFKNVFEDKSIFVKQYDNVFVDKNGQFIVKQNEKSVIKKTDKMDNEKKKWSEYSSENNSCSSGSTKSSKNKKKKGSGKKKGENISLLPKKTPQLKKHYEQMRKEHVVVDICDRSQAKVKKRNDVPQKSSYDQSHPPIYPVFSNHEIFDIGDVDYNPIRRNFT